MWVSYLLGMFSGLPLIGEPDPAEAVGGRLVSVAQKRRTPEAQMCLRALAAVASRGLAERATHIAIRSWSESACAGTGRAVALGSITAGRFVLMAVSRVRPARRHRSDRGVTA